MRMTENLETLSVPDCLHGHTRSAVRDDAGHVCYLCTTCGRGFCPVSNVTFDGRINPVCYPVQHPPRVLGLASGDYVPHD